MLVLGILLPDGVDKALAHVGSDGDFPWVAPLLLCLFKSGDLLSNRQRLSTYFNPDSAVQTDGRNTARA